MIVLRDDEDFQIVEIFDTAQELKTYIDDCLKEIDEGMKADGIYEEGTGVCGTIPLEKATFRTKLETFMETCGVILSDNIGE